MRRVTIAQSGCHEWTGKTLNGYGYLSGGRFAIRISHQLFKGPIPPRFHVDHLCRNTLCVNPEHLEAVSCQENVKRAFAYHVPRRTHCKRGHLWTPENTIRWKNYRYCKTCAYKNHALYKRRKKAGIPSRPIRRG